MLAYVVEMACDRFHAGMKMACTHHKTRKQVANVFIACASVMKAAILSIAVTVLVTAVGAHDDKNLRANANKVDVDKNNGDVEERKLGNPFETKNPNDDPFPDANVSDRKEQTLISCFLCAHCSHFLSCSMVQRSLPLQHLSLHLSMAIFEMN